MGKRVQVSEGVDEDNGVGGKAYEYSPKSSFTNIYYAKIHLTKLLFFQISILLNFYFSEILTDLMVKRSKIEVNSMEKG